jgi:Xaa-Pro aminopeptidase
MPINNRLSNLRRELAGQNVDAILISQPENRRYLSGFSGSAGYLLIAPRKAVLATDFRYIEQAQTQAPAYEIFRTTGGIAEWLPGLIRDYNIRKLGFEAGDITFALYHQVREAFVNKQVPAELVPAKDIVETLRMIKEPEEIEAIVKAVAISDTAYEQVAGKIKAGMTEIEVAWEMEKSLRECGSQVLPFDIIVASGPNAALPHAIPSERVINEGEPVVIDMGARYQGYTSDMTRTLCLGKPDKKFLEVYHTVLEAQQVAVSLIVDGMTCQEADNIAREVIRKAGYGEAFGHALGHGVGLATHEMPRLGYGVTESLVSGMAFTVEPGIYLPGWGGVRIEDTVIMINGRTRSITKAEKKIYG